MIQTIISVAVIFATTFLTPLVIADIINTRALKEMEKLDRKYQLMEKYHLSEESLTMKSVNCRAKKDRGTENVKSI